MAESLFAFADGFSRFRANQLASNYDMGQQLAAVQEIIGVSQKTMAALRANMDARRDEAPPAAAAARTDTCGIAGAGPGPALSDGTRATAEGRHRGGTQRVRGLPEELSE